MGVSCGWELSGVGVERSGIQPARAQQKNIQLLHNLEEGNDFDPSTYIFRRESRKNLAWARRHVGTHLTCMPVPLQSCQGSRGPGWASLRQR